MWLNASFSWFLSFFWSVKEPFKEEGLLNFMRDRLYHQNFSLQAEIEKLSLEEQNLDNQIRLHGWFAVFCGYCFVLILPDNADFVETIAEKCRKESGVLVKMKTTKSKAFPKHSVTISVYVMLIIATL